MRQLIKLTKRPSRDGKGFAYILRYVDLEGKQRYQSLGHSDARKAEKQRARKEKELKMGFCPPESMRLSEFIEDSLRKSGNQIRPSTKTEYLQAMNHLISVIADIDYQTVSYRHGELFRQACLDQGNAPDTVSKKIKSLHAVFQLAANRNQLEDNPFDNLSKPKSNRNKSIRTYSEDECDRLVKAATEYQQKDAVEWDLVVITALTTGMRKSEILNLVWSDIDFSEMIITVTEKTDTEETWEWGIKDTDRRTLPMTEEVAQLLIHLQNRRLAGYPYVFVPEQRYDWIQAIRQGKPVGRKKTWTYEDARISIINNFTDQFAKIRKKAGIKQHKTFHDIRRTAITMWFYAGLEINEVMRLAGHSKYDTTLKYYLSVKDDLISKARLATKFKVNPDLLQKCSGRNQGGI